MGCSTGPAPSLGFGSLGSPPALSLRICTLVPPRADCTARPRAPPHSARVGTGALGLRPRNGAALGGGAGARKLCLLPSSPSRAEFLEGERDINQEIKKKFLHIFKTHVALSEVLFILTKSGGTCPHSARQMEQ